MVVALTAVFAFSQGKTRLGARAAFNMSSTTMGQGITNEFGGGWEAGLLAGIPIVGTMTFNPGLNFMYRQPVNFKLGSQKISAHEYAISTPLLIQLMPLGGPIFYVNGGLQVDFPFNFHSRTGSATISFNDRAPFDVGAVAGTGLFLAGEFIAIDFKVGVGLMEYDTKNKHSGQLIHGTLGLIYWF
jgi:hypothetical protein